MSRKLAFPLLVAAFLTGCSHAGSITHISADYNKAMADVRNEQLLVNILRSSAREPLQFSAMGEIAATVHRSAGVDTTLENLIVGGANAISHTVSVEASNEPVIKLTPLSDKEFIQGMLKPTSPATLQQFIELGWDPEFMLPLMVAAFQCLDGKLQLNTGKGAAADAIRQRLTDAGHDMVLEEKETPGEDVELNVADDKALEMMRSGVAGGYKVISVKHSATGGMAVVRLRAPAKSEWVVTSPGLCPSGAAITLMAIEGGEASAPKSGFIKFRSVEGIIYFLGERLRDCYLAGTPTQGCALTYVKDGEPHYLFRVNSGGERPYPVLVGTRFYDRNYWVSRLDQGDVDRTAKTLSFINQLIALQTEASDISTTPTVLTIGGR